MATYYGVHEGYGTAAGDETGKWGWFVLLGVAMLVLGVVALSNMLAATFASVLVVGAMMLIAGFAQVVEAFPFRSWSSFLYWMLSGLIYAGAGLIALFNPALAAVTLTLVFAVLLLFAGILRIMAAFRLKPGSGWRWVLASGVITALTGLIIAMGWPVNTLWVLGLILAIDLIFQGLALLAFGMTMRSVRHHRRAAAT